jgi:hypothetical protein
MDRVGSPDMWSDVATEPDEFAARWFPGSAAAGSDAHIRLSVLNAAAAPSARIRTADDMLRRYQDSRSAGTRPAAAGLSDARP